jgi:hypothetical protein
MSLEKGIAMSLLAGSRNHDVPPGSPMSVFVRISLLLLLLILLAPAIAGELYKWVDENGTIHYGATPPEGVDAVLVSVDLEPGPVTDPYPKTQGEDDGELSVAEQRRQARAERVAANREEAARIEAECAAQKSILERLEPRPNVIIQNPDGTSTRMDDAERMKLINDAKAFIAKNCPED